MKEERGPPPAPQKTAQSLLRGIPSRVEGEGKWKGKAQSLRAETSSSTVKARPRFLLVGWVLLKGSAQKQRGPLKERAHLSQKKRREKKKRGASTDAADRHHRCVVQNAPTEKKLPYSKEKTKKGLAQLKEGREREEREGEGTGQSDAKNRLHASLFQQEAGLEISLAWYRKGKGDLKGDREEFRRGRNQPRSKKQLASAARGEAAGVSSIRR